MEYYIKKCSSCSKVGKKCAQAFCHNHPAACIKDVPLNYLSAGTMKISNNKVRDVCLMPLFSPVTFKGRENTSLSLDNINALSIEFFDQPGEDETIRLDNIDIMENLIVNYLFYLSTDLGKLSEKNISFYVNMWLKSTFGMTLEEANSLQFYEIAEYIRRDLYRRKGIPTKVVGLIYENQTYAMTVSKLGCLFENRVPLVSAKTQH